MNAIAETNKREALVQGIWFEGALFARILMQTIWITVWYQALMGGRVGWLSSGLVIFLALFVSTLLVRLFDLRSNWRPGLRPAIFAVWMTLFFLASLKWLVWPEADIGLMQTTALLIQNFALTPFDFGLLWHILLIPILIWQGVNLGKSRGSLVDTIRGFKIGILLLILHGLIFMPEINIANSLPWLTYLVLGLIATSINRMADLIPLRGGRLPVSTGKWWAAIVAAALLLITLSLAASGMLQGAIRIIVFIMIGAIMLPSALIMVGFALLIVLIVTWLDPQFSFDIGEMLDSLGGQLNSFLAQERLTSNLEKTGFHTFDKYLIPAVAVLVIALVVLFIFVDLRSRHSWIRRVVSEESVSDVFNRFRQRSRRAGNLPGQKQGWQANRFLVAARIRRIYANLLDAAAKVGAQRLPSQTPLEFLPVLSEVFPDHRSQVGAITRAYLKIRYGGFPESSEEVVQVEAAWEAIRAQVRQKVRDKKREDREKERS